VNVVALHLLIISSVIASRVCDISRSMNVPTLSPFMQNLTAQPTLKETNATIITKLFILGSFTIRKKSIAIGRWILLIL